MSDTIETIREENRLLAGTIADQWTTQRKGKVCLRCALDGEYVEGSLVAKSVKTKKGNTYTYIYFEHSRRQVPDHFYGRVNLPGGWGI